MRIDPTIQNLIPPLSQEELAGLTDSLLREGCRDALVLWKDRDVLLDGHNRYLICQEHDLTYKTIELPFETMEEAMLWVIRNQFDRRNLTPMARAELALRYEGIIAARAKENQKGGGGSGPSGRQKSDKPTDTKKEVAKLAGISHDTIAKAKYVRDHADPHTLQRMRSSKEISINRAYRDVRENEKKQNRVQTRKKAAETMQLPSNILVGDFRDYAESIPDGSLALIFTDPPYDRESTKTLSDLGLFAKEKLCEGGSLICYVGQVQLPNAIALLSAHLRYWWTCCCLHSGPLSLMREYGIRYGWKPMLWFVKGTRHDVSDIVHDVVSGGREKDAHEWQQSLEEAKYWIEHLCPADGIVCDPYLGGGTTGLAAKELERRWIGIEIDADTAANAAKRVK